MSEFPHSLPPQGSGLWAGTRGGTPNFPRIKKKCRIVVLLVCENFLDLLLPFVGKERVTHPSECLRGRLRGVSPVEESTIPPHMTM